MLLDSAALQTSEVFVSNTKKFKRFLTDLSPTDLPALKLSKLAPEEILEYQEIAKQAGRTLLLAPDLAILRKQVNIARCKSHFFFRIKYDRLLRLKADTTFIFSLCSIHHQAQSLFSRYNRGCLQFYQRSLIERLLCGPRNSK